MATVGELRFLLAHPCPAGDFLLDDSASRATEESDNCSFNGTGTNSALRVRGKFASSSATTRLVNASRLLPGRASECFVLNRVRQSTSILELRRPPEKSATRQADNNGRLGCSIYRERWKAEADKDRGMPEQPEPDHLVFHIARNHRVLPEQADVRRGH